MDGQGLGMERPADLEKDDDEFEAYRKRMMLAYRFRPNPLVTNAVITFQLFVPVFSCLLHDVVRRSHFRSL